MISDSKLIGFYKRAVADFKHPDPEKAIFGRAQLSGRKSDYSKGGRVGLFGISEKKAAALGWEDLENPEQNFRAAMDLDVSSFNEGDLPAMYISSAGVTGGEKPKNNFLVQLDTAFEDIRKDIVYDDGEPASIKSTTEEEKDDGLLDGAESKEEVIDETKRQSAGMQSSLINLALDGEDLSRDVESALDLLREYVNKSV